MSFRFSTCHHLFGYTRFTLLHTKLERSTLTANLPNDSRTYVDRQENGINWPSKRHLYNLTFHVTFFSSHCRRHFRAWIEEINSENVSILDSDHYFLCYEQFLSLFLYQIISTTIHKSQYINLREILNYSN